MKGGARCDDRERTSIRPRNRWRNINQHVVENNQQHGYVPKQGAPWLSCVYLKGTVQGGSISESRSVSSSEMLRSISICAIMCRRTTPLHLPNQCRRWGSLPKNGSEHQRTLGQQVRLKRIGCPCVKYLGPGKAWVWFNGMSLKARSRLIALFN